MSEFPTDPSVRPLPAEIEAAREQPGGWVYRVAGGFSASEHVPPEAVFGVWKVDGAGHIAGDFIKNPNYDPQRFPPPEETSEAD